MRAYGMAERPSPVRRPSVRHPFFPLNDFLKNHMANLQSNLVRNLPGKEDSDLF